MVITRRLDENKRINMNSKKHFICYKVKLDMFLISEDLSETIERPTLVDVTELQLMAWTSKDVFDSLSRSQYSKPVHTILWYNLPVCLPIEGLNEHTKTCRFNNCEHTENKDVLRTSSAIVFCKDDCVPSNQPPLNANERPSNQVWIYFGLSQRRQMDIYMKDISHLGKIVSIGQ